MSTAPLERCRWCGWEPDEPRSHDAVQCLTQERDTLLAWQKGAVAHLAPYLQAGGSYAFLMQVGDSITQHGPARLVGYFERRIAELERMLRDVAGIVLASPRAARSTIPRGLESRDSPQSLEGL